MLFKIFLPKDFIAAYCSKERAAWPGNKMDRDDGFIHLCNSNEQLLFVLNRFYETANDVIIFQFEQDGYRLENAPGTPYEFPHIYNGHINLENGTICYLARGGQYNLDNLEILQ
jgi:uncharacterized protein (DUF952 family)